ncbi:ALK and LTK ligand 1 [Ambystoma mexicanum]|uniref:ALK and LTK ligand 1 n=1 Tax=Ambystoma mexicanum TaxID=8296 RepID=UPI0037E740C0
MQGPRKWPFLLAIILLLLLPPPKALGAPSRDEELHADKRILLELIRRVTAEHGRPASRRSSGDTPEQKPQTRERADSSPRQSSRRSVEIFLRDLNLKEKIIKHFTGPVTYSAECSKSFHRLYHNTRDCSTPAYYKRCARLLTRLAKSPMCTQS